MLNYLKYFGAAVAVFAVAMGAYMVITPYKELSLIRQGNTAAACACGGTMIGLTLPLYTVLAHTSDLIDFLTWGGIALVTQLVAWGVVAIILRNLRDGITNNQVSYGVFIGGLSIAIGILNAGAMTY